MTTLPYRRQQVTPRSGGRVAGDRQIDASRGMYPTIGSAALQPQRRLPGDRGTTPSVRARAAEPARPTPPRLRVAPPAPVTAPRAPFVATVLVVVIAGTLGILALNTKINENAFRLQALRDQSSVLDRQEQQLTRDLALLESPTSLAAAARRLGLVPAGTPAFIRLPDGRVLGVPQPASGAQSASGPQPSRTGG